MDNRMLCNGDKGKRADGVLRVDTLTSRGGDGIGRKSLLKRFRWGCPQFWSGTVHTETSMIMKQQIKLDHRDHDHDGRLLDACKSILSYCNFSLPVRWKFNRSSLLTSLAPDKEFGVTAFDSPSLSDGDNIVVEGKGSVLRMNCPRLTRRVLPAFIVINLIILFIYSYAFYFVLPRHPYLHPIAILLVLLAETSLYLTLSPVSLENYHTVLSSEAQSYELCKKCSQPRPPRTHHCSRCRHCIPRMSHHCAVLSTCLGAHNFKPFLLLLFYAFVSAIISLTFSLPEAIRVALRVYSREVPVTIFHVFRAQAIYAQFALGTTTLVLFLYHCYYISTGWTILEVRTESPRPRMFPPWRRSRTAWDRGFWNNLAQVFGTGYLVMLPIVDVNRYIAIVKEGIPDFYQSQY